MARKQEIVAIKIKVANATGRGSRYTSASADKRYG